MDAMPLAPQLAQATRAAASAAGVHVDPALLESMQRGLQGIRARQQQLLRLLEASMQQQGK